MGASAKYSRRSTWMMWNGSPSSASRSAAGCSPPPSRRGCRTRCSSRGARWAAARSFAVAVRSRPPPRICPRLLSPGSRKRSSTCAASSTCSPACTRSMRSLFNDRAIAYRVHNSFDHNAVALSVGVQHMVRSDLGAAGVMFTLDTDSGFRDVVFITSVVWSRRDRGAGRGQSRRVLCLQAGAQGRAAPGAAQEPRPEGHQDDLRRSRHAGARAHGRGRGRQTGSGSRSTMPMSSRSRSRRSSSRSTTARRWTSSGARTAPPARSTSCRRGRRRCRAAPDAPFSASRSSRARRCW